MLNLPVNYLLIAIMVVCITFNCENLMSGYLQGHFYICRFGHLTL